MNLRLSGSTLLFILIPMSCNRYVDNICKNPTEEKYRKIKLSNKVFQVGLLGKVSKYYFCSAVIFS